MPIYEYVCEACGRLTEVMQKVSDPAPPKCPECGEPKLARLVSRTSFQLKGGGWYSDLYSSAKKKPEAPASGSGSGDGAKAPAAKGDAGGTSGAGAASGSSAPAASPAPGGAPGKTKPPA